ncbi:hypothetical protein [uncultured Draconibacterium sp.]|uniref:hypothetical protein n=1 Tax=uncultured Draconibacterium sp. TaxID=1573823 RepID=UPI0029C7BA80|nr:hypothetical protein [uncultured Draconibacterium sp.]
MKKVAIPIANKIVSEYLCKCSHIAFYNMETKGIDLVKSEKIDFNNVNEVRFWIRNNGITDVLLHRIKKELIETFTSERVNLFVGVPQVSAEEIIRAYRCGKLESDKKIITEITN